MTVRGIRIAAMASLMAVLAAVNPGVASGQEEDPADQIAESQQRLEQIRRERSELREELNRLQSQVRDASSELRNIEQQVATSADLLSELDLQSAATEREIDRITRDLLVARNHLAHRKRNLFRRLRDIYKRGPLHTVQVLLTAESFSELLNRYKYLYLIARSDRALVSQVASLEQQLRLRDRQLKRSLAQLEDIREEKAYEHREMERLEMERARALSAARSQEQTASERYAQLEQDEKRLEALIATLERKRIELERARAARGSTSDDAGLTTRDLGSLAWPVEGTVIYRFGREVQSNGTAIRRNGIGIAAPTGTPVAAIEAGTVMMAGPFEGYGPTVIVHHGGGYYSLYLYLQNIVVDEGDRVTPGQTVGSVGGGGTKEGAHVEFQIRAPGGQAVDPLSWLRERGG